MTSGKNVTIMAPAKGTEDRPWAAEHHHERKIKAGRAAIKIGRDVTEIIRLQVAAHAREQSAQHERANFMQVGVDPERSRELFVLPDRAQSASVARIRNAIGGEHAYEHEGSHKHVSVRELVQLDAEHCPDRRQVKSARCAGELATVRERDAQEFAHDVGRNREMVPANAQ